VRPLQLIVFVLCSALCAHAQGRLTFIGVSLDLETRQADAKLQVFLSRQANVSWAPEEMDYEHVLERLVAAHSSDSPFVARVTPYVYLVAEMLGAQIEPLATYVSSATNSRTYRAYLVVRKQDFPTTPTLFDVVQWLKREAAASRPQRFVYHSRFSTSSFFVPSLYFHSQNIYHMRESTESLTAVMSERIEENSSAKLLELVAAGRADIAAVWDGTKKKFEAGVPGPESPGPKVHFVALPTEMPNDLLICSSGLEAPVKDRLRNAIRKMGPDEINIGDFRTWSGIGEAMDARQALADLRWLARARVPAATVEISLDPRTRKLPVGAALLEAARQAVRLAGTELVLFDDDFHTHIDYTWTIERIHDGAVVLHSRINGVGIEDQEFRLSFLNGEDLTRRIVAIAQARLHRIRYVWAYSSSPPTIIRDIAFSIPVGSSLQIQRVRWLDPERNKFQAGPVFKARIRDGGFYRYALDPDDFSRSGEPVVSFDPLSNLSYRAYLLRPLEQRTLFAALTYALVGLLALAAGTAVVASLRGR